VYDRGNSGVPGERLQKKEKLWWDLDVGTRRGKIGIGWKERKGGTKCTMRRERDNWARVKYGCSEMRDREKKERGEISNEDGREVRWIKGI
jgi:hypothetical protein